MTKETYPALFALFALLVLLCPIKSPAEESFDYVVTIGNETLTFVRRPELGYVVKTRQKTGGIITLSSTLSFLASDFGELSRAEHIKPIRGLDRHGVWVIEKENPADENNKTIGLLTVHSQVQYAAPLFSSNGDTVAVIPEIVVRVTPETYAQQLEALCQSMNLAIKKRMEFTTQEYLLEVLGPDADSVFSAVEQLNNVDWVEWAAPNIVSQRKQPEPAVSKMHYSAIKEHLSDAGRTCDTTGFIPNDEYFPYQWHLHNTGQFGGTPDADINAPEAWEITAGDPNIVVVIHDMGVDLNHPDLVNNLVQGYDFYDDDDLPEPAAIADQAHGTNCAGVVAAEGNNNIGVVGVAWKCKVMPIRDGTASSYISWAEEAEAVRWAAVNGADVLSNSWGVNSPKPIFDSAIVDVTKPGGIGRDGKGCVVFASAGNDGTTRLIYPATNPEVIAVGATDYNDARWSYSSYGPELDIVAPGGERWYHAPGGKAWPKEGNGIWTTDITGLPGTSSHPKNPFPDILDYTSYGGTSSSCPVAAGVAALILSVEPELTNEEVRHFLCRSAKDLGEPGRDDYYGWGRIDARAALDMVLAKRADLNNDWKVDLEDLLVLIEFWGATETSVDIAPATRRDGVVDEQDLDLMMRYWQTEIPEPGLIAYWKLDETEGDIAYDSVVTNDGVVIGEAVWQPDAGKVKGTLQFDGIDDYVSTPFILNPTNGAFSVFAWIKGGTPGQVIVSQTNGAGIGRSWLCTEPSDGKLMTRLTSPPGRSAAPPPLLSEFVVTDGNWHHIGFVWDASYRYLYVDGTEVARDTKSSTMLESADGGLYIGAGKTLDAGSFWLGLLDDVRVYDQVVRP